MPEINRVGSLDGNTVDVELDNGNILLLNMDLLKENPRFKALFTDGHIFYPKTDGMRVYWQDGPGLTLPEIMTLIMQSNQKTESSEGKV